MKLKLLFFFYCVCWGALSAQTFKGRVLSDSGEPIPFASIYVKELTSGFIADNEGCFQAVLPVGSYSCEVSSLGYAQRVFTIQLSSEGLDKEIRLSERVYELHEVNIVRNDEDPAYQVMRQAISRAPFYRTYVKGYTADAYIKGTGRMKSIPAILKLSGEVRRDAKKYLGKLFVMEEARRVTYTAPDTWNNEVKAYTNSFPEEVQLSIQTTDVNLYRPEIFGKISPLNPRAFSYYNFKLEGCFTQGEHLINQIKVIPKRRNPELVSGYIYIVQNLWSLSAIDVLISGSGVDATINVTCNEVEPAAFLTTSIRLTTSISMMGMKAEASYLSSIKYDQIQLGKLPQTATMQAPVAEEPPRRLTPKQQKQQDEIAELISREELTTREAYRLSKLVSKLTEATDTVQRKDKFERAAYNYIENKDSLAGKRDSLYWAYVRSVPLRIEEMESYAYKEKLNPLNDSLAQKQNRKQRVSDYVMETLLMGRTFRTKNKKAWLTLGSLSSYIPEFNYVDGLWAGAKLKTGIELNEQTSLHFIPEVYYTGSRRKTIGQGELFLQYAPRRLGCLSLKSGSISADFNGESGRSRLINGVSSLWFGRNDIKFYDKQYVTLGNKIELANGLLLSTELLWERRNTLENALNKGWFNVKAKPNVPRNPDYEVMPENQLFKLAASLAYTPGSYYRMSGTKKYYEPSVYPTLTLHYARAFAHGGHRTLSPAYHRTELTIEHVVDFGMFNTFRWMLQAGAFWDAKEMQFPDFKHFATTRIPVTEDSFDRGFSLLDNYTYSTNARWAQANISWYTPYLLLKQLPFLQEKRFDEALHLRALAVFNKPFYTEIGYSIGWAEVMRIGVFAGFNRLKYQSIGVSVSLPVMRIVGN